MNGRKRWAMRGLLVGVALTTAVAEEPVWLVELVSTGVSVDASSATLDPAGNPWISYLRSEDEWLVCAWRSRAGWTSAVVDQHVLAISATSIDADSLGRPMIAYRKYASGGERGLKVAWFAGLSWTTELVEAQYAGQNLMSLSFDGQDRPRISYSATDNVSPDDMLRYAWKAGSGWTSEVVARIGSYLDGHSSLAFDIQDRPRIAYYDPAGDDLRLASKEGGAWTSVTVDTEGDVGRWCSLALDRQDRPRIAYEDRTLGELKFAWNDGAGWNRLALTSGAGPQGRYASLRIDSNDLPVIAYADLSRYDARLVRHDGSQWTDSLIDGASGNLEDLSLMLRNGSVPWLAFIRTASRQVRFAGQRGVRLDGMTLDPAWEVYWPSASGVVYQVQYTTNLLADAWGSVGPVRPGTGAELSQFARESGERFRDFRCLAPGGGAPASWAVGIHRAVEIGWLAATGHMYQVETSDDPEENLWSSLGEPMAGSGAPTNAFDRARNRQYRVVRLLPD